MGDLIFQCKKSFGTSDLYEVFNLPRSATLSESNLL